MDNREQQDKIRKLEKENHELRSQVDSRTNDFVDGALALNEYIRAMDAANLVIKTDKNDCILHVNDAMCTRSGFSRQEFLGKPVSSFIFPNTTEETLILLNEHKHKQEIFHCFLQFKCKNGDHFYSDTTLVPITEQDGNASENIYLSRDITQLVLKEREIEKLKNREMEENIEKTKLLEISRVLHNIPLPCLLINQNGGILEANEYFFNLFDLLDDQGMIDSIRSHSMALQSLFIEREGLFFIAHDEGSWVYRFSALQGEEDYHVQLHGQEADEPLILHIGHLGNYDSEDTFLATLTPFFPLY